MSLAMQQPFNTFYETGTAFEVGGCEYWTDVKLIMAWLRHMDIIIKMFCWKKHEYLWDSEV